LNKNFHSLLPKQKMFSLKQWWSIERGTLFESDLFRTHFRKTVILRKSQDVALIPIEKDDETHKSRGVGVNWF